MGRSDHQLRASAARRELDRRRRARASGLYHLSDAELRSLAGLGPEPMPGGSEAASVGPIDLTDSVLRVAAVGFDLSPQERLTYDRLTEELSSLERALRVYLGFGEPLDRFLGEIEVLAASDHPRMSDMASDHLELCRRRRALLTNSAGRIDAFDRLVALVKRAEHCTVVADDGEQAEHLARRLADRSVSVRALHHALTDDERAAVLRAYTDGYRRAITLAAHPDPEVSLPPADLTILATAPTNGGLPLDRLFEGGGQGAEPGGHCMIVVYARDTVDDPAEWLRDPTLDPHLGERLRPATIARFEPGWTDAEIGGWLDEGRRAASTQPGPTSDTNGPNDTDRVVGRLLGWPAEKVQLCRLALPHLRTAPAAAELRQGEAVHAGLSAVELRQWRRAEIIAHERREVIRRRETADNGTVDDPAAERTPAEPVVVTTAAGGLHTRPVVDRRSSLPPQCNACGHIISPNARCGCS